MGNNSKAIVIYSSKRGVTKQYAEWIAAELDCTCVPQEACDLNSLAQFDLIIYGGWLRGSGIVGFDKFKKYVAGLEDRLIVFTCGISEYNPANYMQICEINFDGDLDMSATKLFYCPGAYNPENVKGLDKFLMAVSKRVLISGQTGGEASEAAAKMKDAIENGVDNVDRRYARQVVNEAKMRLGDE